MSVVDLLPIKIMPAFKMSKIFNRRNFVDTQLNGVTFFKLTGGNCGYCFDYLGCRRINQNLLTLVFNNMQLYRPGRFTSTL